jgi:TP901 family phage tail tape measure protein
MANNDALSIVLRQKLDTSTNQISELNKQINQIAKKINKLNVKLDIDTKGIDDILKKVNDSYKKAKPSGGSPNPFFDRPKTEKDIEIIAQKAENTIKRLKATKGDNIFTNIGVNSELTKTESIIGQFRNGTIGAKELSLQMDHLKTKTTQVSSEFKNVNKDGYGFATMMEVASKKVLVWAASTQLIYGSLNQLRQGVTYITELDNSLNEIRIVTGKTEDQVNSLAKSYNSMAKEMNTTTKDIVSQSVELFRQGLSENDVNERMKSIIMYAKISKISLEDSNKIITATANSTGESVQKIIDIFSQLGDSTASGADEIGEALQRVASASENSGLSLEKTASLIATISSITRESASTIGRSLSSSISRYESIKSTGFNDEDSTKLNDVVKALDDIGIKALDAKGQLKPFGDVLDMVGGKFSTLSKNEQAYITTAMFGTYQRNRGLTLLRNYDTSLKNYQTALNSAGVAEQKFAIYQESTQAVLDKATASWEGMWQASLNSGAIKTLMNGLSAIFDFMTNLGGIIPIVAGIIGGVLVAAIQYLQVNLATLITELGTINLLSGGLPILIGLIVTAITALGFAIANNSSATQDLINKQKELKTAYESSIKSADEQLKQSEGQVVIAEKLAEKVKELNKVENLNTIQKIEMKNAVEELNNIMPDLNLVIDEQTGKVDDNNDAIKENILLLSAQAKAQAYQAKASSAATAFVKQEDLIAETNANLNAVGYTDKDKARLAELNKKIAQGYQETDRQKQLSFQIDSPAMIKERNQLLQKEKEYNNILNFRNQQENDLKKLDEEINSYTKKALTGVPKTDNDDDPPPPPPSGDPNAPYKNTALENFYLEFNHKVKMGELTDQQQIDELGKALSLWKTKEEYYSILEEIYSLQQNINKDAQKAAEDAKKAQEDAKKLAEDQLQTEKDKLQSTLDILNTTKELNNLSKERTNRVLTANGWQYLADTAKISDLQSNLSSKISDVTSKYNITPEALLNNAQGIVQNPTANNVTTTTDNGKTTYIGNITLPNVSDIKEFIQGLQNLVAVGV